MDDSVAVVGLGNAGLPLAAVIADRGLKIVGVDVNHERCEHASLLVPSMISIIHAIEYWLAALPYFPRYMNQPPRVQSRGLSRPEIMAQLLS